MQDDDFIELLGQLENGPHLQHAESASTKPDGPEEDPFSKSKEAQLERMRGLMCSISLWVQLYDHRVRGGPLPFVRGGEYEGAGNGFEKRKLPFHVNSLP